ncbi:MAG: hypothetical protein JRF72_06610 [Deltaproteobacteria bacterium]|nr:hypothetical protein [Deltaproteobacteria bacterium]
MYSGHGEFETSVEYFSKGMKIFNSLKWSAASIIFVKMFEQKDFVLINVHIPYQGEIPGTELLVPFNQLDRHRKELPEDKGQKIVV